MSRASVCPSCGRAADAATGVDDASFEPAAGSVAVCACCAELAIFTGDGVTTRLPTDEERRQIEADPRVRQAIVTVKRYHRARAARWN